MITVVIKSPEMAENERKIREKEMQIEEMEKEKAITERIEKDTKRLCEVVNDLIEKAIARGSDYESKLFYVKEANTYYNFWESYKQVKQIFEKIGYKIGRTTYSNSWTRRSGKYAIISVEWEKEVM